MEESSIRKPLAMKSTTKVDGKNRLWLVEKEDFAIKESEHVILATPILIVYTSQVRRPLDSS